MGEVEKISVLNWFIKYISLSNFDHYFISNIMCDENEFKKKNVKKNNFVILILICNIEFFYIIIYGTHWIYSK